MVLTASHAPRRSADERHARQVAALIAISAHLFFAAWLLRDFRPATPLAEPAGIVLVDVYRNPTHATPAPVLHAHVRPTHGREISETKGPGENIRLASERLPVAEGSLAAGKSVDEHMAAGTRIEATGAGLHLAMLATSFRPPKVLHRIVAAYPGDALRAGHEGETEILVTIGSDSTLRNASVSGSSGDESLDRAALAAVARYTWRAAQKDDLAVEAQAYVTVAWKIAPAVLYGPTTTLPQDTRLHEVVERKNALGFHIDAQTGAVGRGPHPLDARTAKGTPDGEH
jgi:TonB family protein